MRKVCMVLTAVLLLCGCEDGFVALGGREAFLDDLEGRVFRGVYRRSGRWDRRLSFRFAQGADEAGEPALAWRLEINGLHVRSRCQGLVEGVAFGTAPAEVVLSDAADCVWADPLLDATEIDEPKDTWDVGDLAKARIASMAFARDEDGVWGLVSVELALLGQGWGIPILRDKTRTVEFTGADS